MAPIKRPLSRENTSPSQKMMSFFCRDIFQYEISPLSLPAFGFSKFIGADSYSICCQAPIRIKAMKEKLKSDGCVAERSSLFRSGATFLFLATPGPLYGPQKNIGTLSCPMGCDKIKGSKRANHSGLMTRADHKKGYPPGFCLRECNGVPTKLQGFEPLISKDHRCSPRFNDRTVPHEKALDLS